MSEGSLKELYDVCDGKFDIPFGEDTFSVSMILREALKAAVETSSLLYVYRKGGMYRLTPQFPDGWKTTGVARVYPGGRTELRRAPQYAVVAEYRATKKESVE
jgi:hypothetical protein